MSEISIFPTTQKFRRLKISETRDFYKLQISVFKMSKILIFQKISEIANFFFI